MHHCAVTDYLESKHDVSDLVFRKSKWYHDKDGKLVKVDYEKEVKEYYKKWRTYSGGITKDR